jgi:nucleoid DNA-binding protein
LNPRKPKTLNREVAKHTGQNEQLISDLMHFYWGKVRKDLSSLEQPHVRVANFGTFNVRLNKMEKRIQKYEGIIKKLDVSKYTGMAKYTVLTDRVTKMKNLIEKINIEISERSAHYEKKNAERNDSSSLEG